MTTALPTVGVSSSPASMLGEEYFYVSLCVEVINGNRVRQAVSIWGKASGIRSLAGSSHIYVYLNHDILGVDANRQVILFSRP
jgi:hypothetical protein